jgi:hypothetical protein
MYGAEKKEKFRDVKGHVMVWMESVVGEKALDSIDVVQHMFLVGRGSGGCNGMGCGNNDSGYQRYRDIENFVTSGGARRSIFLETPQTNQRKQ